MSMTAGDQPVSAETNRALGDFFDQVSEGYDTTIFRTVPPYREMFEALIGYCFLPVDRPLAILELGCGTGNLTQLLAHNFPQAHLSFVDLSGDMLVQTARKLDPLSKAYTPVRGGFMDVDFPEGRFDLVTSSIALHHLSDEEKPAMYRRIYGWLKPGGRFRCADQVMSLPVQQAHDGHEVTVIGGAPDRMLPTLVEAGVERRVAQVDVEVGDGGIQPEQVIGVIEHHDVRIFPGFDGAERQRTGRGIARNRGITEWHVIAPPIERKVCYSPRRISSAALQARKEHFDRKSSTAHLNEHIGGFLQN